VLFAFNFVCVLAAAIVILSLAGRELGIRELLPADEREIDDRDTSLSRLVAITLLPFLGMYAAFGQVAEAANRLVTQQWVRYGFLSDQQTVLGALYDLATQHLSWLVALLAGIYMLRRLLDFIAERTGLRILDLLAVLVESFFMLLVIVGGIRVLQTFQAWLEGRAVMQWLAEIQATVAGFLAISQVKVGTALKQFGEIKDRTDGIFVAITMTGAATGPKPLELAAARLLSGDVRYEGYQLSAGVTAQPGFQTTVDSVFEVDPAQMDDLIVELGSNEVLHGHQQRVRIKLALRPASAEQWRAAARGVLEPATSTTRAIP
jgi:hypothetical protein